MNKILGDIAKLQGGYAYKSRDLGEVGLPVVKIGDVTGGGSISYDKMQKIPLPIATETERFATSPGDTLISMTGANVGKVARVGDNDPLARINQRVGRFVPIPAAGYCKDYIHYIVSSKPAYQFFANAAYGSAQPNISGALIEALPVPEIEPDVANKIGKMLASLDNKIELNRRMNETLEEMARALFRDWFVDFGPTSRQIEGATDPAAIMGHAFPPEKAATLAPLFPATLGDDGLPKGWALVSARELASKVQNGGTPSRKDDTFWENGDIPWLTSGEVRQAFITHTANFITQSGLDSSSAKWVPAGSTVIALYGATAGQVSFTLTKVTTNQAICALLPKDGFRYFLLLAMRSRVADLEDSAVGSAQQNISKKIVEEVQLVVPDSKVASQFDSAVKPLFQKIESNLRENQTLAEMRDLLLPKLMSGEIRLKDVAAVP